MEEWKDVVGYEGLYKVSSTGKIERQEYVKAMPNGGFGITKKHTIKPYIGTNGYIYVQLSKNGKAKKHSVHRLVAEAFIPNPNGYKEVNHKDENIQNPCVDNLEWCDREYNSNYGTCRKRQGIAKSIPIDRYSLDGIYIDTWASERQYRIQHGITGQNMIIKVCKRIKPYYTAYGYRWKFVGDNRPFEPIPIGGMPVYQYTKDNKFINEYPNAMIASKETGVQYTSIRRCVNKKLETAGGFIWKGVKDENN